MRSYRRERMGELRGDFKKKHVLAGKAVVPFIRAKTPIGTPASTGDPDYKVTARLWRSIGFEAYEDHVDIGVKGKVQDEEGNRYAPYVHQGTYDYAHGYEGWEEGEARAFDSLMDTGDGPGRGRKGMRSRPFCVNGLLDSRVVLNAIYGKPIN